MTLAQFFAYNTIVAIVIIGAIAAVLVFFPIPGCVSLDEPPPATRTIERSD